MVMDNWVRTYGTCMRPDGTMPGWTKRDIWYRGHRTLVNRLVDEGATVLCAVYPPNPGYPLGWICFDDGRIHYVFVRNPLRKMKGVGVGGALLEEARSQIGPGLIIATHTTPIGKSIIDSRAWLEHDPWSLANGAFECNS